MLNEKEKLKELETERLKDRDRHFLVGTRKRLCNYKFYDTAFLSDITENQKIPGSIRGPGQGKLQREKESESVRYNNH